ncbi:MAG TPA: family 10 glycosylhydrolase, partial [Candidatus Cryptobacteroides sp.]|nr:family 10 glycosylhydrolase [Candidatus Cryptobacteroides sp.]
KEGAVFGVSPQGLIVNTCMLYADPKRWVSEKSLDYLVSQLYWSMDRGDAAAFPKALEEWKSLQRKSLYTLA